MYTKKFLYYLKGVMNFQIPKSVIYIKSDRFLAVLYFFALSILQVQGTWSWDAVLSLAVVHM